MDVLIKIYRPNTHPKFPNGGKLTPFLENMKIGECLDVEGPLGRFNYRRGFVRLDGGDEFPVKKLVMIAGGTGITPMFNVLSHIVEDKEDTTQIVLLYGNRTEEDILLRKELEGLGDRIKMHLMIDVGTPTWKGFVGYIRKDIMEEISNMNDPDTLYCHSGPFLMNKSVRTIFEESFPKCRIFKF